jgi:hypothetical protein
MFSVFLGNQINSIPLTLQLLIPLLLLQDQQTISRASLYGPMNG